MNVVWVLTYDFHQGPYANRGMRVFATQKVAMEWIEDEKSDWDYWKLVDLVVHEE